MPARCLILIALVIVSPALVHADIYMFIDSNGVIHFTNVPTSSDYTLYIKERPKKKGRSASSSAYDPLIQKAATAFDMDFHLIKAVIQAESAFDPDAVSKKGAKGLMQIMPDNFDMLSIQDPFDPEQNIMGGTQYLKTLMQRYDGKLPLALSAYNAGPEAVDRYKAIPPFPETQSYVSTVMKTYYSLRD